MDQKKANFIEKNTEDKEYSPQPLTIMNLTDNEDGSTKVNLNISKEFMNWFKENQGLKRWSQKRFEKWFSAGIRKGLSLIEEGKKEK